MRKTYAFFFIFIFVIVFVGTAFADIIDRITGQQYKINQGVASRELTRNEADILQDNLNWIRAEFGRMKADRRLTQKEIRKLDMMLDQNDAMIYNKKHNPVKRVYQADIPERILNQQYKINQGVASRELTRNEADILQDNLNWIRAEFGRMKADRRLTQKEIRKLDMMLDQNDAMIYNKKHNLIRKVH
jgi:septal ring factor EnvC (AmiA/AmiB activator)